MTNERGFALLGVMLVLALLGVVVGELSVSMRLEASMVRSYKENVLATHLAEAAIQQAIREILGPGNTSRRWRKKGAALSSCGERRARPCP